MASSYRWHEVKPEDQTRITCDFEDCSAGATRCQHVESSGALSFHCYCADHSAVIQAKFETEVA
jgi:hypothetical protein